ncbi:WSC domain protein [Ophiocordyceps camponoti-floridani]|uniref:WSC domain protein n=1 Tax=Ophiocordyceps camponoti-floridani TaxID=2030778 RepID=A0A8H4Q1M4_9HYPO|nr:WSC domain protein [Ophiocordyceps camponoti-floridani]
MKPLILTTALAALATAKDHRSFAVLRFTNKQLTKGRMDPIRSPGKTGAHVHHVLGGSGFGTSSTGKDLLESNCSTAKVKGDNSNYWFPSLYFRDAGTGKLEGVDLFYANAYYFFEATNDDIKAFPTGLSIVSGDVDATSAPVGGSVSNLDASKGPINAVKWTCPRRDNLYNPPSWPAGSDGSMAGIGDAVNKGEGVGFPHVDCDGFASPLRADIHFPSCYDPAVGLTDYKRNMVFPSDAGDGKMDCPKGHIHVPHLFLEVYWDTPAFKDRWEQGKGKQPFVLSNGDATGFSLHADFMAGWDEKVLQHVIDTCDAGTAGMDKCPGLPLGLNEADCTVEPAVKEKVDGVLDALPGDNGMKGWSYGGTRLVSGTDAPAASSGYSSGFGSESRTTSSGLVSGTEAPVTPSGPSSGFNSESPATSSGTPSASASEYPPPANSEPSPSRKPTRYQLPVKELVSASTSPSSSAVGYHVPSRAASSRHYTNSTMAGPTASHPIGSAITIPATSEACITKTVTVRQTVTVTNRAPPSAVTSRAPPSAVTNRPSTNSTVNGYRYTGCFRDSPSRILNGVIRADVGAVSNANCVDHCRAAGYGLAGTEYGGQCYCGSRLLTSDRLDDGRCDMACEGDAADICGGSWALSVYGRGNATEAKMQRHLYDHVRRRRSLYR